MRVELIPRKIGPIPKMTSIKKEELPGSSSFLWYGVVFRFERVFLLFLRGEQPFEQLKQNQD